LVRRFLSGGFILILLSAFVFAIGDILIKSISPSFHATEIAFFRFLIGGVILWPIISSTGTSIRGNHTWMLLLRGFLGTSAFLCLLRSIAMIPLTNAMVLFYTFPLFAASFSFLLFGENVGKIEILLIMVGLIGIYILINPSSHIFNIGYIFGLLAGCISGLVIVLIRKLRETNGAFIIYFYFCLVGGILSFPFFVKEFKMPNLQQVIILVSLALILLIGQLLMNQGLKFCKASEGSVIMMSEVVFAGVAGVVMFKDPITHNFLAGASLIVGSGVGLNLMHQRLRRSQVSSKR
jgi:drug/metabolite transporter (DMT)-like permease